MAVEQKVTFCRICEPLCGLVATVDGGELTRLRPDDSHPLSRGNACPKGIAMTDVQNDPDRVIHPLKRVGGPGEFERVSWREAIDDIVARLRVTCSAAGPESIGWYMGNPGAFSYSHTLWAKGFLDGLGSRHYYTAGSQDVNSRFAASAMLYGSPLVVPIPDLQRTDFLFMLGANPLVSHGSVLSAPRIRDQLNAIVQRQGRVVVVDPRRSETARQYEHLPIRPDADAWLLLSMLNVIFEAGLVDRRYVSVHTTGVQTLEGWAAPHTPEATESMTGVPAERVRELALAFAEADTAAAYGRTGSCLGRHGTAVAYLLDCLNAVTGNLDRPGGAVFGRPAIALDKVAELFGLDTYGKYRSRIGGYPDVLGNMPATLLPEEITTPGPGQLRALFVSAGNPVLSVPDGDSFERAFSQLDLMVSLDFYVNETNRHADYILPSTTWLEREDIPLALMGFFTTPFVQFSEATIDPRGEARQEWEVIDEISKGLGAAPYSIPALRLLSKAGIRLRPRRLVDALLRVGPFGDWFGLRRSGLSLKKLAAKPHGVVLGPRIATGVLKGKLRHRDKRVRLDAPAVGGELARLDSTRTENAEFPLRLIGMRELRSHNSWMHNAPLLMRGGRSHTLRMHPEDASAGGIADGDLVNVNSEHGSVEVPVAVSDEVMVGTVALPHGWGHRGGWRQANEAGGANVNLLTPSHPDGLEKLAGMAHLNGVPVRVELIARQDDRAAEALAARA